MTETTRWPQGWARYIEHAWEISSHIPWGVTWTNPREIVHRAEEDHIAFHPTRHETLIYDGLVSLDDVLSSDAVVCPRCWYPRVTGVMVLR